jgi:hypothetical protein
MVPFHSSRLKIERAKQHISDLHERSDAFSRDCYSLTVNTDPDTGNDFLKVEITKTLPDEFPLIIGDALHNLKSALDLAINEIVWMRLKIFDDHSRFPFRNTRDEVAATVKGGKISQASKAVSNLIVNVIEPYERGKGDALWCLHRLDVLDKHRLLLPVWQFNAIYDVRAEDDRGRVMRIGTWPIVGNGSTIRDTGMRNVKITHHGKSSTLILFEEGFPVRNESVLPALIQFVNDASATIDGIEAEFLAEESGRHRSIE